MNIFNRKVIRIREWFYSAKIAVGGMRKLEYIVGGMKEAHIND